MVPRAACPAVGRAAVRAAPVDSLLPLLLRLPPAAAHRVARAARLGLLPAAKVAVRAVEPAAAVRRVAAARPVVPMGLRVARMVPRAVALPARTPVRAEVVRPAVRTRPSVPRSPARACRRPEFLRPARVVVVAPVGYRVRIPVVAVAAVVPLAAGARPVRQILRAAIHPAEALRAKASSRDPVAAAVPVLRAVPAAAAAQQAAAQRVPPERWRAVELQVVPEQTQAACRVAVDPRVAAPRAADREVADRLAAEPRAEVPLAVALKVAARLVQWGAVPRVGLAGSRRPAVEPLVAERPALKAVALAGAAAVR